MKFKDENSRMMNKKFEDADKGIGRDQGADQGNRWPFAKCLGMLMIIILLLISFLLMGGCTRKVYVPVETRSVRTDTLREFRVRVDSVVMLDSVRIREKGDSVIVERVRDRVRVLRERDTVYSAHTDTLRIREPYPVEVPRNGKFGMGNLEWMLVLIAVVVAGICLLTFFRRFTK